MKKQVLWATLALFCSLSLPGLAADATVKPVDSTAKTLPVAATPISKPAPDKLDPAAAQCGIEQVGNAAEIEALKRQVTSMQTMLQMQQQPVAGKGDYRIRTKNLPAGTYRDRCIACVTAADEDGERMLMCSCPTPENRMERLSLVLSLCGPQEDISLCGGMLMCGVCRVSTNLRQSLPKVDSVENNTEILRNVIDKK